MQRANPSATTTQPQQTRQQREQERLTLKYGDQTLIERKIEQDALLMFKRKKDDTIEAFTGYFEFLKNEFPTKVYYKDNMYNSVAHAYMAA
jgi:hypothetical protein